METKIIVFNSLKGGVGKTTLLYSTTNELLKRGKKVLVIDLDSQCNTSGLYDQEYNSERNVYNLFMSKDLDNNIVEIKHNLDLVPGSIKTSILSNELINQVQREQILFKSIRSSNKFSTYDYVIVDTHPDFSIVTQNALIIADMNISPIIPNQFSFQSIELLSTEWKKFIEEVEIGNTLVMLGNNIKHNTSSSREFIKEVDEMRKLDDYTFFNTFIPSLEIFNKITLNQDTLEEYPKAGKAIKAMEDFINEVEELLS